MHRYDYINREWIVSATAYRVYRLAAWLSMLLFCVWSYVLTQEIPPIYAPMTRILVLAGVIGAGTVFVGMEYFLFRFDDSHALKQIAWFCVMLLPLLGPALYCFVVYSRSEVVKNCLSSSETKLPLKG
jgi:hypothetical protein